MKKAIVDLEAKIQPAKEALNTLLEGLAKDGLAKAAEDEAAAAGGGNKVMTAADANTLQEAAKTFVTAWKEVEEGPLKSMKQVAGTID